MSNLTAFAAFSLILLVIVACGEVLRGWVGLRAEVSRRFVHAATGVAVALSPLVFTEPAGLYILAAAFVLVNLVSVARGWFPGMHGIRRRSLGTVTFPLALLVALWTCWTLDPARVYILQIAFLVLALSDPLASIVGTTVRRPRAFLIGDNVKSVAGSAAFLVSAFVLVAGGLLVMGDGSLTMAEVVMIAFAVASVAAGAEAVSTGGWDNLFLVLAVIVPLTWVTLPGADPAWMVIALAIVVVFCWASVRAEFLTLDGTLAAGGLAYSVLVFGGWAWAVPAFAFFLLSSLLSKAGKRIKAPADRLVEKGSTRDRGQVYANGGVGWVLLAAYVFFPDLTWLYWGFVGSFAAAAADTWATEIGTMARGRTRSVWTWRPVEPGTSGGVSAAGTMGGLAGAVVITGSALPFAGAYLGSPGPLTAAALVAAGGLLASLIDSVLGARWQAVYRDRTGAITERRPDEAEPVLARGRRWLTNDRVNVAGTVVGAAIPIMVLLLL